jgi:hypothetical protein
LKDSRFKPAKCPQNFPLIRYKSGVTLRRNKSVGDSAVRKGLGLGLLALGVVGLGWWGSSHNAHRIEHKVRHLAEEAVAGTVHGITTTVAGRDIHVTGRPRLTPCWRG